MKTAGSKTKGTAFALWACGLMGIGGLHRFYLGKPYTGWIYFITFDLFLIGLILDCPAIPKMVEEANKPAGGNPLAQNVVVNVHVAAPTAPAVQVREVVKLRCRYCGTLVDEGEPKCPDCGAKP